MNPHDLTEDRTGRSAILVVILLAAGIIAGGIFSYRSYARHFRAEAEQSLATIADLKVSELAQWRAERLGDGSLFLQNVSFSALVRRWLEKPEDAESQRQIQRWLENCQTTYRYDQIRLLDVRGVTRMAVPAANRAELASVISRGIPEVLRSGRVMFQDFYWNEHDQRVYLAVLVPILDEADGRQPLGALVLCIDPETYLYPFIRRWPTPRRTAETLLVRRDGTDALFLNELKFQTNTALKLRIPLAETNVAAVKAVLGQESVVEGRDYRGVPVLAALRTIPNSPWLMVARMDTAEVYAPLRSRLRLTVLLMGALLLGAGACVGLVWREQRFHYYRARHEAAEALRASEVRYRRLFESAKDGILILDAEAGMVVDVNPFLIELLGFSHEQFLGKRVWELGFFKDILANQANFTELQRKEGIFYEERALETADGRRIEVEFVTNVYPVNHHRVIQCNIRDITERKRVEVETRRLLDVVQQEKDRLSSLVNSISDEVWFADTDKRFTLANPSALREFGLEVAAGIGVEQLAASLEVLRPDGTPRPAEEAPPLRALKGEIVRDLEEMIRSPASGELRYRQVSSSPVRDAGGAIIGSVSVVRDITERKLAQEELRKIEERLRLALEAANLGTWDLDLVTDNAVRSLRHDQIWGYPEPQPQWGLEIAMRNVVPEDRPMITEAYAQAMKTGVLSHENRIAWPDRSIHWIGVKGRVNYDQEGRAVRVVGVVADITERKLAEEALQKQNRLIQTILEHAPIGFAVNTIKDGAFQYVNAHFEVIYGVPHGALRSVENFFELVYSDPVYREELRARIMADIASGDPARMCWEDVAFTTRTGESKVVTAVNIPLLDQNLMVSTVMDVTHRKRAEEARRESETRYRSLFENMLNGLAYCRMLFDGDRPQDFVYLVVNQAFGTLTGLKDVVGKKVSEVIPGIRETDPRLFEVYGRVARTGVPERIETYVEALKMWFAIAVYSPGRDHFVAVFDVITERKQAEESLRTLNAELEHRVRERTAQFEAANKELEAFSYSVSHDLRAPLRHVLGFVEMLAQETGDQLSEKGQRYLQTITDASKEMGELIDDLLAFSRMGRAEMRETSVDLDALVQKTLHGLETTTAGRNIVWKIPPLPVVQGDSAMLKQVLVNLLGNAVKYSRPRDPAQIELGGAGEEDGRIILFVRDNGVGFDPQYAGKLFGVFQRLHRADEFEGTGVGLANVRRIIARHGGRTWAEGKVNEGATFYFTLKPISGPVK